MKRVAVLWTLCAAAVLSVGGCSSDPDTNKAIAAGLPFVRSQATADPNFIAAVNGKAPRAIAVVESNPDAIGLFVQLAVSDVSGVGTWITSDGSQLMLSNGVLVGSRGFGGDVIASDIRQSVALIRGLGNGYATRLMTLIDGEDRAVTRAFKCQISPGNIDPVVLDTLPVTARTVTEDCRGEVASFQNFYWVVPGTGEIIQSSQWTGTVTGKISLRKLPASAG